jgi:hypothetical protein
MMLEKQDLQYRFTVLKGEPIFGMPKQSVCISMAASQRQQWHFFLTTIFSGLPFDDPISEGVFPFGLLLFII